jgi:hypothetical protein
MRRFPAPAQRACGISRQTWFAGDGCLWISKDSSDGTCNKRNHSRLSSASLWAPCALSRPPCVTRFFKHKYSTAPPAAFCNLQNCSLYKRHQLMRPGRAKNEPTQDMPQSPSDWLGSFHLPIDSAPLNQHLIQWRISGPAAAVSSSRIRVQLAQLARDIAPIGLPHAPQRMPIDCGMVTIEAVDLVRRSPLWQALTCTSRT